MQKTTIYRKPMGENLFEEEFTIEALSQMGNPLEQPKPSAEGLIPKDCI